MIACPKCSNDLPVGAQFCSYCGYRIRHCLNCGVMLPKSAEFCVHCGVEATSAYIEKVEAALGLEEGSEGRLERSFREALTDQTLGFFFHPNHPERHLALRKGDNTVGAGDKNDIVLRRPAISWNHALVICRNDRLLIQDSASTNGTFLNDVAVHRPMQLRHGDQVRFGNVALYVWLRPELRNAL